MNEMQLIQLASTLHNKVNDTEFIFNNESSSIPKLGFEGWSFVTRIHARRCERTDTVLKIATILIGNSSKS